MLLISNESSGLTGCPFSISEQYACADTSTDPVQPAGLRRSPHSSSPTLTDYVRESLALWVEKWTSWSSRSQTVNTSSTGAEAPSKVTFTLGDQLIEQGGCADDEQAPVVENVTYTFVDLQQRTHLPQSCMAGLQRTATMPELRVFPCECQ